MVGVGSSPVLVLSAVTQGYSRGRTWQGVVSEASLSVELGEIVAVIGGRLSGKTTLLSIAAGLMAPEAGSVRLGETELTGLSERERGKLRGHEIMWLNAVGMSEKLRVSKIVGFSLQNCRGRGEQERRVHEALERVGAAQCLEQCWGELSRFQQVLVAYAQVFVGQPRIVVIDDLLDSLGEPRTQQASDLLRSLIEDSGRGFGVLMSASDRDSALFADRVWSLENGRLIPTAGHGDRDADVLVLRRRKRPGGRTAHE
jgi:putative ABC transport system ATP-binding protein